MGHTIVATAFTPHLMIVQMENSATMTIPLPSLNKVQGVIVQARDELGHAVLVDSQLIPRKDTGYDSLKIMVVPGKKVTIGILY